MFDLTHDQKLALQKLQDWQKKPDKQFITLGGYAGTGKTALVAKLRQNFDKDNPKLKVAFCAFTGKAAAVLKFYLKKYKANFKNDSVSTIHSLIYQAIDDEHGRVIGWKRQSEIEADLIIIDEASMVSNKIWQDLLSFDKPIIAIGDHGQLPPIGENFSLMQNLDLKLEQIHRQAAQSPIIKLSMLARKNGHIPVKKYSSHVVKYSRQDPDINSILEELISDWNEETLFLVGRNKTRTQLNQEIRTNREIINISPQNKDRIICLKNNWKKGIFNGMLGNIQKIKSVENNRGQKHWFKVEIMMDDGSFYEGKISAHQFGSAESLREVKGLAFSQIGDLFDFGYALTVHKAQGSQAKKAVVFEERNRHMNDTDWKQWLYTAVTRAEEELVIIGD
jgi:ATP-dependent exoDNAse (exonuclease V) alpha subunit